MSQSIETAAQQANENPAAIDAAVDASLSKSSPADPVQQQLQNHETWLQSLMDRLTAVEQSMTRFQPLISTVETIAAGTIPGAAPVINRISSLESFAQDMVNVLQTHFSGKLNLPAAPETPKA